MQWFYFENIETTYTILSQMDLSILHIIIEAVSRLNSFI